MAFWLRTDSASDPKPLPFRGGVGVGSCLDRDQQAFWNPSTPHPSSKEEGLEA